MSEGENKTSRIPKVELLDFNHELSLFIKNQKRHLVHEVVSSQSLQKKFKINEKEICAKQEKNIVNERSELINIREILNVGGCHDFKLYLHSDIEQGLCKGKYFSFKVILDQQAENTYPINEVIQLEVLVYNNDDLQITKNMKGQDILRGNFKQNMHYFKPENKHVAYFRIQITEVSSHFVNKNLNLLIRAKDSGYLQKTGWTIEPISVKNLLVRAKKNYL